MTSGTPAGDTPIVDGADYSGTDRRNVAHGNGDLAGPSVDGAAQPVAALAAGDEASGIPGAHPPSLRVRRLIRRFTIDTRPLRHPAYRRLWSSSLVTAVGSQLTAVAVPKQIYDITHSSGWIGIASFAGLAPLIVFGLWGGAIADAFDRRKLMLATNCGVALTSIAFWIQAAIGVRSVWLLAGLMALQQAMFGLNSPARGAAIPRLVPKRELAAANALGSTTMLTGALFGPLLAGALIPIIGLPTLYLIDALGLTVTLWAVFRLPPLPPLRSTDPDATGTDTTGPGTAPSAAPPRRTGLADVIDGFRFVSGKPLLALSFVVDLIAMVLGMPRALFPQIAATTFASNHFALGFLYAAMPAGALIGGLLSGTYTRLRRHGLMTIAAVATWGVAVTGFGLAGSLPVACAFMALGGAADFVSMVFRSAILQSTTPDDMRGRMQGVFIVVVTGGPRLADLVHGLGGAALGTRTATVAGGAAVFVCVLVLAALTPSYLRYKAAE
ncbi:MAG TPA: MFS transporter [Actinocrinis sp.]|nr:MFS transporter [Actinocrinis sp.]HEV3169043.1 MFS transporter [Actinocrinis sp.]